MLFIITISVEYANENRNTLKIKINVLCKITTCTVDLIYLQCLFVRENFTTKKTLRLYKKRHQTTLGHY